jgi:hypothetical protein
VLLLWVVTPYTLVGRYQHFGETQPKRTSSSIMGTLYEEIYALSGESPWLPWLMWFPGYFGYHDYLGNPQS